MTLILYKAFLGLDLNLSPTDSTNVLTYVSGTVLTVLLKNISFILQMKILMYTPLQKKLFPQAHIALRYEVGI